MTNELIISIVLAFIIILMIIKARLYIILFAGALLTGLLHGVYVIDFFRLVYLTLVDWITVRLLLIVILIRFVGSLYERSGALKGFGKGIMKFFKGSILGIILPPMLVGLLPMPGGALFTAPLVKESSKHRGYSKGFLTYINFWFRHLWEYDWPLYPGIILAIAIYEVSLQRFVFVQLHYTLIAVAVGIIFMLIYPKKSFTYVHEELTKKEQKDFIIISLLVLVFLLSVIILRVEILYLLIALLILSYLFFPIKRQDIKKVLKYGLNIEIILILFSVMYFKKLLFFTHALEGFAFVSESNLLLYGFVFILPFIVGFLTGVNQAYAGIAFPVLLPFIHGDIKLMSFSYVAGFAGVLLSPAHLCLVLTKEYYRAQWGEVYKWLIPSVAAIVFALFITVFVF